MASKKASSLPDLAALADGQLGALSPEERVADEAPDQEVVWIPCLTLQVLALYYEGLGILPRGWALAMFGGCPEADLPETGDARERVSNGPARLPPLPDGWWAVVEDAAERLPWCRS